MHGYNLVYIYIYIYIIYNISAAKGGGSGVFYILLIFSVGLGAREVSKKLPGGRRIHPVRVSAQTEPRRPDSDHGIIFL